MGTKTAAEVQIAGLGMLPARLIVAIVKSGLRAPFRHVHGNCHGSKTMERKLSGRPLVVGCKNKMHWQGCDQNKLATTMALHTSLKPRIGAPEMLGLFTRTKTFPM